MADTINAGTTLRELNNLYNTMPASNEAEKTAKDTVFQQIQDLTKQVEALRKSVIDETLAQYAAATKSMANANKAIADAQKDISKVANTVSIVAKAVTDIGELLKVLSLGV